MIIIPSSNNYKIWLTINTKYGYLHLNLAKFAELRQKICLKLTGSYLATMLRALEKPILVFLPALDTTATR